jgi:TolB-like protein
MKKFLLTALFVLIGSLAFAQELIIVVAPFDIKVGSGFSKNDTETIEYLFINELSKSKVMKVLDQSDVMFKETIKRMDFELSDWSNPNKVAEFGKALNANAVVLGRMMTLGNEIIIAVRINDLNTEIKAANDMVITSVSEVRGKLPAFTAEIINRIPKPVSPLIGSWYSKENSFDWDFNWLLIFNPDGTLSIQNYRVITEIIPDKSYLSNFTEIFGEVKGTYLISGNNITFNYTISGIINTWVEKSTNRRQNSYKNQGIATISFSLSDNKQNIYIINDSYLFLIHSYDYGKGERKFYKQSFDKIN